MDKERIRHHLPSLAFAGAFLAVLALGFAGFIYFGIYNVAADAPHSPPVYALLDGLRDRSIAARASAIHPPADLAAAKRVAAGAGLYGEMCASCHLGPGVQPSELSQGLYPQAPELAKGSKLGSAEQFWIIKHGIKLSAMPAWGKTHSDALIWDMVAFVQKLPGMSAEQYRALVTNAPEGHDAMMNGASAAQDEHAEHTEHGEHHHDHK